MDTTLSGAHLHCAVGKYEEECLVGQVRGDKRGGSLCPYGSIRFERTEEEDLCAPIGDGDEETQRLHNHPSYLPTSTNVALI